MKRLQESLRPLCLPNTMQHPSWMVMKEIMACNAQKPILPTNEAKAKPRPHDYTPQMDLNSPVSTQPSSLSSWLCTPRHPHHIENALRDCMVATSRATSVMNFSFVCLSFLRVPQRTARAHRTHRALRQMRHLPVNCTPFSDRGFLKCYRKTFGSHRNVWFPMLCFQVVFRPHC